MLKYEILYHANMQMCKLLRIIFYGIKVVPLTTLAAGELISGMQDRSCNHPKPCNDHSFPSLFKIFDIFINIHEYADEITFI